MHGNGKAQCILGRCRLLRIMVKTNLGVYYERLL